jgi:hypothetical protein
MASTLHWIGPGLLAALFALTGALKLIVPRERLQLRMHWAGTWPRWRIRLLGLAEVAGALGLVLPRATGIAPLLTPLAAVCLGLLMLGAVQTHLRLGESPVAAALVSALCFGLAASLLLAGTAVAS